MKLPQDPVMLLSYINTQLRDFYPSLDELCKSLDTDKEQLINKLFLLVINTIKCLISLFLHKKTPVYMA